jgi:hypothetical protein
MVMRGAVLVRCGLLKQSQLTQRYFILMGVGVF